MIHRRPRRNIQDILDRLEARQALPSQYPPDFRHGRYTLEELVEGRVLWNGQLGFVCRTSHGWGVGKFHHGFLTIHVHLEHAGALAWASRHAESSAEVVFLDLLEGTRHLTDTLPSSWKRVGVSPELFVDFEREQLGVDRECDTETQPEACVRTTVLSMLALRVHDGRLATAA